MSSLSTIGTLQVITPDPTGDGGLAINENFRKTTTKFDTSDPASSDDTSAGYRVGSRWINTKSGIEYVCVNDAAGAAVWAALGTASQSMIKVTATGSPTENGTALLAAYLAAAALAPYGNNRSASNRAVILLSPGIYDLGTGSLAMNAEYVDLVGSGAPEDTIITSACNGANTGTVMRTVDDIRIANLTLQCTATNYWSMDSSAPAAYFPTSNNNFTKGRFWRVITTAPDDTSGWGMRLGSVYGDTWEWCINTGIASGSQGRGWNGTASGTFVHCTNHGDGGFGGHGGVASGTFTNCINTGDMGFAGEDGVASGKFINCRHHGNYGFAGGTMANGQASGFFMNCIHDGNEGFGGEASGTFLNCIHNGFMGFGGRVASGTFRNCIGGGGSFGVAIASGKFINCQMTGAWMTDFSGYAQNMSIKATGTNQNAVKHVTTGAIFKDCVLVATGTGQAMVGSDTGQTVKFYGTNMSNRPLGADVTAVPGLGVLTVSPDVTLP
ncbi:MAG: hypothetical protein FWD53_05840 [Phycisphaerales bacterium]|nr:hypothetical protein [Phycisphaerales bacterium]